MFEDRTDGGERLAELLVERGVDADVLLAIPRGGLPVGRAVDDGLATGATALACVRRGTAGRVAGLTPHREPARAAGSGPCGTT